MPLRTIALALLVTLAGDPTESGAASQVGKTPAVEDEAATTLAASPLAGDIHPKLAVDCTQAARVAGPAPAAAVQSR